MPVPTGEDATLERQQHDPSEIVQADSDGQGKRAHTVRRLTPMLDRLHRAGKITPAQFHAGDWLRDTAEQAQAEPRVVMGWEGFTSASGGANLGFLPANELQMRARDSLRTARQVVLTGLCAWWPVDCYILQADGEHEPIGLEIEALGHALSAVARWRRF